MRRFEIADLGGRGRCDEPLDVVLEHGQRRACLWSAAGTVAPDRRRLTRSKIAEEIVNRARFDDLELHASAVEPDVLRAHGNLAAVQPERADDDMRGADDLAQPDDRGVTQAGNRWDLKLCERVEPLFSRVGATAERVEVVGDAAPPTLRPASTRALPATDFQRE